MKSVSFRALSPFLAVGLVAGAIPFANGSADDPRAEQVVLTSTASGEDLAAEKRYLELVERTEPVAGQTVEQAAIAVADGLSAVPVSAEEPDVPCPAERLAVRWSEPGDEYRHGAFVPPLGPAPEPETQAVNGIVVCAGSPYAYMGFEADLRVAGWHVTAVPYLGDETGEAANDDADPHGHEHDDDHEQPSSPAPRLELPTGGDLGPIEGYAAYEPQRICHGTVKPGTEALKQLLLGRYPVTRNLGIVRGCSIGGRSEHKEGRAFDWGAYVSRADERKAADDLIARLLATDADGNRHALARRMGVMYMIWNGRIWSAYRAADGWRPYGGASPHTDHVHISLSWDGAMARTSFWRANGVDALLAMPAGAVAGPGTSGGSGGPATGTNAPAGPVTDDPGAPSDGRRDEDPHGRTSDEPKAREEDVRDEREQERAREGERARRRAEGDAREREEQAQRDAERAERKAAEAARDAERQAERDRERESEREAARQVETHTSSQRDDDEAGRGGPPNQGGQGGQGGGRGKENGKGGG